MIKKDILNYNFDEDIEIAETSLQMSLEDICKECDANYSIIKNLTSKFNKEEADKFYNYLYQNGLYINNVKWDEYTDLSYNENIILAHGTRSGIFGDIKIVNQDSSNKGELDFGSGFYLGQTIKQACMFVSNEDDSSFYIINFNSEGLNPYRFNVNREWLLAVAYYRHVIPEYENSDLVQSIISKVDRADYIISPIADNRVFELIDKFVDGELTDVQCACAMSASHLGYQYVFKKPEYFDRLEVINHCYLCPIERSYYSERSDIESNVSLYKSQLAKKKFANKGKYITEIFGE